MFGHPLIDAKFGLSTMLGFLFCAAPSIDAQNSSDPNHPYDPDATTIGLYHLDEGSGSTASDASSNSIEAGVFGATWTSAGRFGGALQFDGNGHVFIATSPQMQDATFEAWVYLTTDTAAEMAVIDRLAPQVRAGRGLLINKGHPVAYAMGAPARWYAATGQLPLPLREWVHLAAIFDETRGSLKVSVNGRVVDEQPMGCCTTEPYFMTVGRINGGDGDYFVGKIDEIRISSIARVLQTVDVRQSPWSCIKELWR